MQHVRDLKKISSWHYDTSSTQKLHIFLCLSPLSLPFSFSAGRWWNSCAGCRPWSWTPPTSRPRLGHAYWYARPLYERIHMTRCLKKTQLCQKPNSNNSRSWINHREMHRGHTSTKDGQRNTRSFDSLPRQKPFIAFDHAAGIRCKARGNTSREGIKRM